MARFVSNRDTSSRRVRAAGAAGMLLLAALATVLLAATSEEYDVRQRQVSKDLAQEHYVLGMWCLEQKLPWEAREEFERVLLLEPTHAKAAEQLGQLTPATRRNDPINCEFTLVNGDHVKGELLTTAFQVQTPAGSLLIPANETDLIQLAPGPTPDRIISDGYVGEGHVNAESFSSKTKVGTVTVKRQDVNSIRILRPCPVCSGQGELKCRRCGGTGRLSEKNVCPDCQGKGFTECASCKGTGKVTCPLCGGLGQFRGLGGGFRGRLRRVSCPRCNGAGKIDCPDCEGKGRLECPTCKGKPVSTTAGICPICNGQKKGKCEACGGTGSKPLPKLETEEPQKPEEILQPPE